MYRFKYKKLLEYEYSIYILIIVLKCLLYITYIHIILIKQIIFFFKEKREEQILPLYLKILKILTYILPLFYIRTYQITLRVRYQFPVDIIKNNIILLTNKLISIVTYTHNSH